MFSTGSGDSDTIRISLEFFLTLAVLFFFLFEILFSSLLLISHEGFGGILDLKNREEQILSFEISGAREFIFLLTADGIVLVIVTCGATFGAECFDSFFKEWLLRTGILLDNSMLSTGLVDFWGSKAKGGISLETIDVRREGSKLSLLEGIGILLGVFEVLGFSEEADRETSDVLPIYFFVDRFWLLIVWDVFLGVDGAIGSLAYELSPETITFAEEAEELGADFFKLNEVLLKVVVVEDFLFSAGLVELGDKYPRVWELSKGESWASSPVAYFLVYDRAVCSNKFLSFLNSVA